MVNSIRKWIIPAAIVLIIVIAAICVEYGAPLYEKKQWDGIKRRLDETMLQSIEVIVPRPIVLSDNEIRSFLELLRNAEYRPKNPGTIGTPPVVIRLFFKDGEIISVSHWGTAFEFKPNRAFTSTRLRSSVLADWLETNFSLQP